jgi:hypothetical protein
MQSVSATSVSFPGLRAYLLLLSSRRLSNGRERQSKAEAIELKLCELGRLEFVFDVSPEITKDHHHLKRPSLTVL